MTSAHLKMLANRIVRVSPGKADCRSTHKISSPNTASSLLTKTFKVLWKCFRALGLIMLLINSAFVSVFWTDELVAPCEQYMSCEDYLSAQRCYDRVLTVINKRLGPLDQATIKCASKLATAYIQLGQLKCAEAILLQTRDAKISSLGSDDRDLIPTLLALGDTAYQLGKYAEAEVTYRYALSLSEKHHNSDNTLSVIPLMKLGLLYSSLGLDYKKKDFFLRKALEVLEKTYVSAYAKRAWSLQWIASISYDLEDYDKSEYYLNLLISEIEKDYGTESRYLVGHLTLLGSVYDKLSETEKAENCFLRALAIEEKNCGHRSLQAARTYRALGHFQAHIHNYEKAAASYDQSLNIFVELLGTDNREAARMMALLSDAYYRTKNLEKATFYANQALRILPATSVENSDLIYCFLEALGDYARAGGEFDKSLDYFIRAERVQTKMFQNITSFATQEQKLNFLLHNEHLLSFMFSLVSYYLPSNRVAKEDLFNVWLKRKGLVFAFERSLNRAINLSDDPTIFKRHAELNARRFQLSSLSFLSPNAISASETVEKIQHLKESIQMLETELFTTSDFGKAFWNEDDISPGDCAGLAASLPEKSVLIDFVRINLLQFGHPDSTYLLHRAHYLAFVLPAKCPNRLELIDLGEAKKIEDKLVSFRNNVLLMGEQTPDSARDLYKLIFEPIRGKLRDQERLIISPDGELHLIPFEVLQAPSGKYLIEDYVISYVSATQEVFGFGQSIPPQVEDSIIIGDPAFDLYVEDRNSRIAYSTPEDTTHWSGGRRSVDLRDLRFRDLHHTKEEAIAVQSILGKDKARLFTGVDANESLLRHCTNPRILHVATHGFFLSDQQLPKLGLFDMPLQSVSGHSRFEKSGGMKILENPMLRSGLALTGANSSLGIYNGQNEDGILTAEEVLGLKLWGTEMVVLSACDTGLGALKNGEGVFGLRRAFALAGAKSLVMSLWSVPDEETKELMVQFYSNLKTGGMDRCQALRQAMLREMKIVEERYGYAYPLCWGGFVFVGDPG